MNFKQEKNNIIWVVCSNAFCMLIGLTVSFLFPKFVDYSTYAGYKTYTLYITYIGFLHFGFINGIYLKFGGCDYDNLPSKVFSLYTKCLLVSQLVIQILLFVVLALVKGENMFSSPLFFVALNVPAINISCYFSLVNQFGKRFKIDSLVQLIGKLLSILVMFVLLIKGVNMSVPYLIGITLVNYTILFIWIWQNKCIVFAQSENLKSNIGDLLDNIKRGFFIMISEYMGLLILGIDSIFINLFFSEEEYSLYAFAVSIVSIIFAVITIISKLIFPYLMRMNKNEFSKVYSKLSNILIATTAFFLLAFFVIDYIIVIFIPKYENSIVIVNILAVLLIYRTLHELIYGNFYKALQNERGYAINNLIAFLLALVTDGFVFVVWREMTAIAIASVVTFIIWHIITNHYFQKTLGIKGVDLYIKPFLILLGFYICMLEKGLIGMLLYISILVPVCFVTYKYWRSYKEK